MTESPLRIFISYCHEDTWGEAMLLGDRLANRFGNDNVFLDVRTLHPGMEWLEEIKSQRASCTVFLALIGPRWTAIMKNRAQQQAVQPAEDYVRFEIEYPTRRRRVTESTMLPKGHVSGSVTFSGYDHSALGMLIALLYCPIGPRLDICCAFQCVNFSER